jgi:hypothetical protein
MQLARFEQYTHERLRIASDNSDINDSEEEGEIIPSLYKNRQWEVITNIDIDDKSNLLRKEIPEPPVVCYRLKHQRATMFTSLKKWRGVVLKIYNDYFLCRLVDQGGNSPDEEAEILLSEISEEDLQLIGIGAVFYWSIGYQTNPSGTRTRSSIIRFRRIPVWRPEELSEAQKKAEKTLITLGIT